jgi:hypothetical protein
LGGGVSDDAVDRCHLCRRELDDAYLVAADGSHWCTNTVECNFRARRRLGMPVQACVEAKAADLERLAVSERRQERPR